MAGALLSTTIPQCNLSHYIDVEIIVGDFTAISDGAK